MNWLIKNKKWITIFIVMISALIFLPRLRGLSVDSIVNYTPASIPLAVLIFIVLYALKAIVMVIPVTILYIAAGIVFPSGWAIIITYLCLAVALSIGYINGKKLGADAVNKAIARRRRVAEFLDSRKDNLLSLCFISRILPVPFDLLSMFLGALGMPFLKYIFVSLLGLSTAMVPSIFIGASISNPMTLEFLIPAGACFFITLTVFIIYKRQVFKKTKRDEI